MRTHEQCVLNNSDLTAQKAVFARYAGFILQSNKNHMRHLLRTSIGKNPKFFTKKLSFTFPLLGAFFKKSSQGNSRTENGTKSCH